MVKINSNAAQVVARVGDMAKRMRDLTPVLRIGALDIDRLIDDSFEQQRGPGGALWAPLKRSTIKSRNRRRKQSRPRTLQDTGRLRRSWNARATASSIVFGTNVPYARFHQQGGNRIPARRQAPAERIAGVWKLITRGPAGRVLERLRRSIDKYVRTGRV